MQSLAESGAYAHATDSNTQLDLFAARLPRRPYCSDNPQEHGLRALPTMAALERRYIEFNGPGMVHWLCLDLDRPYFPDTDWRTKARPNLVVRNRPGSKNPGRAHALFGLAAGVTRTSLGRVAPLRYLANISEALRHEMDADIGYAGVICKNPHHDHWEVEVPRVELYDLGELAEHVDLHASAARIKATPKRALSGLGRNCSLFDSLRTWAYKEVTRYRNNTMLAEPCGFDGWHALVIDKSRRFNVFANPLPESETKAIGRSVAKWVWSHYDGRKIAPDADYDGLPANTFSLVQSNLGRLGMESRWGDNTAKQAEAVKMAAGGLTQTEIAHQLEVSQQTVSRWLKPAV